MDSQAYISTENNRFQANEILTAQFTSSLGC